MDDKNFLQSIKLEISKSFKLDPYERIAFHRLFSYLKSDADKKTLVKDLDKEGHVRVSALISLSMFDDQEISNVLKESVTEKSLPIEILAVSNFFKRNGSGEDVEFLINLLELLKEKKDFGTVILNIFETIRIINSNDEDLLNYIRDILSGEKERKSFRIGAFSVLASYRRMELFDEYITKNDDETFCYIFQSIYKLNTVLSENLKEERENNRGRERYVEKPLDENEELSLRVKVFLGKSSGKFDGFQNYTKIAFINALLSCNHRESSDYVIKALGSNDNDLITMTLYSLYNNITRLHLPDTLFRSLISFNVESELNNELITEIIVKYFSEKNVSRSDLLFRDKEFGYISATLESYFETFRREFMIPDVVENTFPENFKSVRDFILRKFNPEFKRKFSNFLYTETAEKSKNIINELSGWIYDVKKEDEEKLSLLIDLVLDEDPVSRENSANRIDTVNFDKRYLQSKIIRLCKIISSLQIESASTPLVYIYNYLKKYPEPEIFDEVTHALCRLNYSYMLSEVEIMLSAGSPEEQEYAVRLLGIFREKRLINILVEYVSTNAAVTSDILRDMTVILSDQEIRMNINASDALKKVIENNSDQATLKYAILGLGNCGFVDDLEYFYQLDLNTSDSKIKESIVKSIYAIISTNDKFNKQILLKKLQEYLKDPSIRVRIFSCIIMIHLGDKDALRHIRDMLIIKNKSVQREILTILKAIESPDFYFFLVSLMRREYEISKDIIGILKQLPSDDLKEIDNFLVNLFRKFEVPDIGNVKKERETLNIEGLEEKEMTVLFIKSENVEQNSVEKNPYENLKNNILIDSLLVPPIKKNNGTVSYKLKHDIVVLFDRPENAIETSMQIKERLQDFNRKTVLEKTIQVRLSIMTQRVNVLNDEIFNFIEDDYIDIKEIPVNNRIIIDDSTAKVVRDKYQFRTIPEIVYSGGLSGKIHYEILSLKNFNEKAMKYIEVKEREKKEKHDLEIQIQEQVKSLSSQNRSKTSISIASDLEDIGFKLRTQFTEIERYVIGRSTDRELTKNVSKMLNNIYDLYRIEVSKLTIK